MAIAAPMPPLGLRLTAASFPRFTKVLRSERHAARDKLSCAVAAPPAASWNAKDHRVLIRASIRRGRPRDRLRAVRAVLISNQTVRARLSVLRAGIERVTGRGAHRRAITEIPESADEKLVRCRTRIRRRCSRTRTSETPARRSGCPVKHRRSVSSKQPRRLPAPLIVMSDVPGPERRFERRTRRCGHIVRVERSDDVTGVEFRPDLRQRDAVAIHDRTERQ